MEYIEKPTGKVKYTLDGAHNSPEFEMDISAYPEMCKMQAELNTEKRELLYRREDKLPFTKAQLSAVFVSMDESRARRNTDKLTGIEMS